MIKKIFSLILLFATYHAGAQKIEAIYFHLYTDSIKKGYHNYINVDGKLENGRFMPLTDKEISFSANTGRWEGNDIIVDPDYKGDTVVIKATLKQDPSLTKTVTIHIKKVLNAGVLKTEDAILNDRRKPQRTKH